MFFNMFFNMFFLMCFGHMFLDTVCPQRMELPIRCCCQGCCFWLHCANIFFFAFISTSQWNAHFEITSKWIHVRIFLLNFQGKCVEAIYKLVPTKFKEKCAGGQKKGLAKMQGYSCNSIEMSKDMKIKGKSWHPVDVYCIVYCYLAAFPLCIWLQIRHSGPDKMPLCLLYQRRNHMKTQRNGNNIYSARKKNALQTHEMSMKMLL